DRRALADRHAAVLGNESDASHRLGRGEHRLRTLPRAPHRIRRRVVHDGSIVDATVAVAAQTTRAVSARRGRSASDPIETDIARRFSAALRRWFRANGRDLPWRKTRDPYRVLVSELMLQQTQVSRVVPKYAEF